MRAKLFDSRIQNPHHWYNQMMEYSEISLPISKSPSSIYLPNGNLMLQSFREIFSSNLQNHGFVEIETPTLFKLNAISDKEALPKNGIIVIKVDGENISDPFLLNSNSLEIFLELLEKNKDIATSNRGVFRIGKLFRHTNHEIPFLQSNEHCALEILMIPRRRDRTKVLYDARMLVSKIVADSFSLPIYFYSPPTLSRSEDSYYENINVLLQPNLFLTVAKIFTYNRRVDTLFPDRFLINIILLDRLIGTTLLAHGDNLGLTLPRDFPKTDTIIVPVGIRSLANGDIFKYAYGILEIIKSSNIRCLCDDRQYFSAGYKFHHWEALGIPIRIEIGSREVDHNTITISERINNKRTEISVDELVNSLTAYLEVHNHKLLARYKSDLINSVTVASHKLQISKNQNNSFIQTYICNSLKCSQRLLDMSSLEFCSISKTNSKFLCVICKQEAELEVLLGKYFKL